MTCLNSRARAAKRRRAWQVRSGTCTARNGARNVNAHFTGNDSRSRKYENNNRLCAYGRRCFGGDVGMSVWPTLGLVENGDGADRFVCRRPIGRSAAVALRSIDAAGRYADGIAAGHFAFGGEPGCDGNTACDGSRDSRVLALDDRECSIGELPVGRRGSR